MSYFKDFPKFDFEFDGVVYSLLNISKRNIVLDEIYTTPNVLSEYKIKTGDTPQSIAYQLYDDEKLYWVVLLVNKIVDIYEQWPKDVFDLEKHIENKYGVNADDVHHYEDYLGNVILQDALPLEEITTVTNREYEIAKNDKLTNILLLEPVFINDFVSEFRQEIS